jgi:hypothetical protein
MRWSTSRASLWRLRATEGGEKTRQTNDVRGSRTESTWRRAVRVQRVRALVLAACEKYRVIGARRGARRRRFKAREQIERGAPAAATATGDQSRRRAVVWLGRMRRARARHEHSVALVARPAQRERRDKGSRREKAHGVIQACLGADLRPTFAITQFEKRSLLVHDA